MAVDGVKIPAKHYVGMVKRQTEKIPLGFITPWGEDAAAKKRIATVDSWAKQSYYGNKALPAMVIDNVPMSGFKMTTDIRSSSYGGVDKWRIEDPRGFELEITSHNLAQLLSVGMIDRGEIADTCVWARSGQQNVLLSTATEAYKLAVKNTEVAAMTASWQDVKTGNTVLLQNNVTGVWLGRMFGVSINSGYSRGENQVKNRVTVTDKSLHVIYVNDPEGQKHKLMLLSSPKLAAITNTATQTDAAAELLANQLLVDTSCTVETTGYRGYIALTVGSPKLGETAKLSLKPMQINTEEILKTHTSYGRDNPSVYIKIDDHLVHVYGGNYFRNNNEFIGSAFSMPLFEQHQLVPVGSMVRDRYYSTGVWNQTTYEYTFDPEDVFYAAVVTINTRVGNTIEAYVR